MKLNKTETKKFKKALNRFEVQHKSVDLGEQIFDFRRLDPINYNRINLKNLVGHSKPIIISAKVEKIMREDDRAVFVDIRPYIRKVDRKHIKPLCDHINIFNINKYFLNDIQLEVGEIVCLICRVKEYRSMFNEKRYTLCLDSKLGYPILSLDEAGQISKDDYVQFQHYHLHSYKHKHKKK